MSTLALSRDILLSVDKPARYIGPELNAVIKEPEGLVRFAMCFPDLYEIGMSHLGIQILYDMFNSYPDVWCERVYSPWPDLDKIMRERNIDERIIHAVASHGYMLHVDIVPEHEMEKVLYATDELTGLIGAVAIMRPSKSVQDLELKSVKEKYKSANFAAGCSREVIQRGADMLGWSLDELITRTILAMRSCEEIYENF